MFVLLAVFLVASVFAEQLHEDGYYFFFAADLSANEMQTLVALYEDKYVTVNKDKSSVTEQKEKVRKMIDQQKKIIRITRKLFPTAFERLVAAADAKELHEQQPENAPRFQKRNLLSLDEDVNLEMDVEEDDDAEEAKAVTRGGNGNHKHCESGREVQQLSIDKMPDLSTVHPDLSVHVDEEEGTVHFSVTLPYIPYDGQYIVSFDPIEHAAEIPLECSSNYDTDIEYNVTESSRFNIWGHAPNANYRDAFSSKKDYAAYYSAPSSRWTAQASGCSHVKYGATFTIEELSKCADSNDLFAVGLSQLATTEKSSAISLVGMVWISYLQPSEHHDNLKNAIVVAKWSHPFSVTVDERDSKIILVDSANGGVRSVIKHTPTIAAESQDSIGQPRAVTVMRRASLTQDGRLELNLQTRFSTTDNNGECVPTTLKLASIMWREFEVAEAPQHDAQGAYCTKPKDVERAVVLQDWRIRSKQALHVYDGDFLLLFCDIGDQTDEPCDETNAFHRTNLGVRMSIEDTATEEKIEFHSEITQHVSVSADESKAHTGAYESGQRACMQSYVIGPKDLTSQIEVKLVEAWLCTSDEESALAIDEEKSTTKDRLSCNKRAHTVQLVGTDNNTSELVLNKELGVTVHHPGAYGLLSVGVCFDVNARFTDSENRSIVEKHQRYESKVRMLPATIRRIGAIHVAPMFTVLEFLAAETERQYDPSIEALSTHAEDQSLQSHPFVAATLRKTIDSARQSGLAVETHAHEFNVLPTDVDDPILSETESAIGIAIVFIVLLSLGILLYFCVVAQSAVVR